MKILLINALYSGGGTEVQSKREIKVLQQHGHEAWFLTFDENCKDTDANHINIPYNKRKFGKVFYRNIVDQKFCKQVRNTIEHVNPDVIHINNLQDNAFSVLHACKGYKVVKTIRDPGLICPKATCLLKDSQICKGAKFGHCISCIGSQLNYQISNFQRSKLVNKYRNTVDKFICPSQYLANACTDNDLLTECVNNPFDFTIVKKTEPVCGQTFLYYGFVSVEKGVKNLMEAFKKVHDSYPEAKLLIAGKLGNIEQEEIDTYKSFGVEYLGILTQPEVMELYKRINCVIVPSIWLENYPNTILESLACKTMVIGSNRGGIASMIANEKLLFDPLNIEDISNKIKNVLIKDEKEYCSVVESNYRRTVKNNNVELFYSRIISIFKNL